MDLYNTEIRFRKHALKHVGKINTMYIIFLYSNLKRIRNLDVEVLE